MYLHKFIWSLTPTNKLDMITNVIKQVWSDLISILNKLVFYSSTYICKKKHSTIDTYVVNFKKNQYSIEDFSTYWCNPHPNALKFTNHSSTPLCICYFRPLIYTNSWECCQQNWSCSENCLFFTSELSFH